MSASAGHHGEEVRNDCWIEMTPGRSSIEIESSVRPIFGRQIEAVIRQALRELGIDGVGVKVVDSGAFDWCLRARFEAAARKLDPALPTLKVSSRPTGGGPAARPRRTRLYLPGNTPKYFINASLHGPDAVILDLEDSVPIEEKAEARALVRHALAEVDFGSCERMVRVNRGEPEADDLRAVESAGAETVLVPKVESAEEVDALPTSLPVIPLLESARGMASAAVIARARGVSALAIGVEDYLADLGARREALPFAFSQVVNAARAAGIAPLASVWTDIDDIDGLAREARRWANLGFAGAGCLHPAQIAPVLRAFTPTAEEVEQARRIVEAYRSNGGVVAVDGRMVDAPVAARAQAVLDRSLSSRPGWRLA